MHIMRNGVIVELTQDETQARLAQSALDDAATNDAALFGYMQNFRDMRREMLNVLTGIAIAEDMLEEFKVLRQVLLDIPQAEDVASAATAEEAKAAIKIAYAQAVALAPQEFIVAFKELDQ